VIPLRECIYGLDVISDRAILCEGPFDVYRLYPFGIALMGLRMNPMQMYSLFRKNLRYLLVCLDRGAERKAERIAFNLSSFIPKIEIALLETGKDPGECKFHELLEMKKCMI
jgi:DNA primase